MKGESWTGLAPLGRVVKLTLERAEGELVVGMEILDENTGETRELRFLGAVDVRMLGNSTELKELVLLMVRDISSSGWEGVTYQVKDYEGEFISLGCREIVQ